MLICTNDGFIGLDRAELPASSETFTLRGYDAGSEENTEMSVDIVDGSSDLGPVALDGDPNVSVDSGAVGHLLAAHDWDEPAARLPVVKIVDAFGDDDGDRFEAEINLLKAVAITTGTSPTTFSPEEPMTRGQMAAFLNRALQLPAAASSPFTDTGGRNYTDDVDALFASGITTGTSSTTYSPNDTVTRSQEAGFLTRALGPRPIIR